jgi:hypothetical protein
MIPAASGRVDAVPLRMSERPHDGRGDLGPSVGWAGNATTEGGLEAFLRRHIGITKTSRRC